MPDRSVAPPSYPIEKLNFDFPDVIRMGDNIKGMIIGTGQHPVVNLELIFKSGKWYETKPGVSYLALRMLTEGTAGRSSEQISNDFESLGSFIDVNAGLDHCSIKVYSLKKYFVKTINILADILLNATFPDHEFKVQSDLRHSQIANQLAKNPHYATLKFNEHYFGDSHPQGKILTPEISDSVTREDAYKYFQTDLLSGPKVILSGHIEDHQINEVDNLLRQLNIDVPGDIDHDLIPKWGRFDVKREDTRQSSLRIGAEGIHRSHADFHEFSITNALLGGFFGSRLMKNIREDKGLTYGIYSSLVNTAHDNYWMISSELMNDKLDEALDEIDREITRLSEEQPPSHELDTLKNYLRGKLLTSLDSIFGKVSVYKNLFLEDLPWTFLEDYLNSVNEIRPQDISEMTGRYFNRRERIEVVVS